MIMREGGNDQVISMEGAVCLQWKSMNTSREGGGGGGGRGRGKRTGEGNLSLGMKEEENLIVAKALSNNRAVLWLHGAILRSQGGGGGVEEGGQTGRGGVGFQGGQDAEVDRSSLDAVLEGRGGERMKEQASLRYPEQRMRRVRSQG